MTVKEQAGQLRYDAPSVPRLGIPAYNRWNEGLHGLARSGVATMFPQANMCAVILSREYNQNLESTSDIAAALAERGFRAYALISVAASVQKALAAALI